jgi:Kef-type K+ transport system membrane component KefB
VGRQHASVSAIEILVCLILLFLAVPDLCRKLGRPALAYPAFVLFGLSLGPLASAGVKTMLHEAGAVGFLLLLFQVGLEMDLPRLGNLAQPLRFALPWLLAQYPVVLLLAHEMGFGWAESLLTAASLTGVSVGMAFPAWQSYPGLVEPQRGSVLRILIVLEALTMVLLAVESPALKGGLSFILLPRLAGIVLVVLLVARFARHLTRLFQTILEQATHWRTHLLVLLVLALCALGDRLGLPAAKTAFFLGLFMSRGEHEGKGLEDYMAPVSQRFLIPILFVSLGLRVEWALVLSWTGLMAFGVAGLLLGLREVLHRRWLSVGGDRHAYLLLCPNLTIVALGASTLLESQRSPQAASWLLLTGLFLTVFAIALLPVADKKPETQPRPAGRDQPAEPMPEAGVPSPQADSGVLDMP